MNRVGFGRSVAIAEIPQPGIHLTGRSVGELDGQIVITFRHTGREAGQSRLRSDTLTTSTSTAPGKNQEYGKECHRLEGTGADLAIYVTKDQ